MAVEFKSSMSKNELLEIAAEHGIEADDSMKKNDILKLLEQARAAEGAQEPQGGAETPPEGNDPAEGDEEMCIRDSVMTDMLVNFKSRLMAIPSKLAPVLCKKTDKAEIFALLKDHIDEALMELSDFKATFGERVKEDEKSDG